MKLCVASLYVYIKNTIEYDLIKRHNCKKPVDWIPQQLFWCIYTLQLNVWQRFKKTF